MSDVVVTVPVDYWTGWIAEGDAVGDPVTGEEWGFYLGGARPPCRTGDRCYVVAHKRLRGYAPIVRVERTDRGWAICRRAEAVAVTIPQPITGFRGWRTRWWDRTAEVPFPAWEVEGVVITCGACRKRREIAIVLRSGTQPIMREGVPVCGPCLLAAINKRRAAGLGISAHSAAAEARARELVRRIEIADEHEQQALAMAVRP